jgi:hypothetical protein
LDRLARRLRRLDRRLDRRGLGRRRLRNLGGRIRG